MKRSKTLGQRFGEKIDRNGPNGCWLWLGQKSQHGYGFFWVPSVGRDMPAHKIAWIVYNNKDVPDGMEVCHKCDVPNCVNPNHLFLATHYENMQDRSRKGRTTNYRIRDFERYAKKMSVEERFWSYVKKGEEDECWEWQGSTSKRNEYGAFTVGGGITKITYRPSRYSYVLHYGPIPSGLLVMHMCDNPPCVNPKHLKLGTNRENILDCESKGRGNHPAGEDHPNAKLIDADVIKIRELYRDGTYSQEQLAALYNVHPTLVSYIVLGKVWTHLPISEKRKQRVNVKSGLTEDDIREIRALCATGKYYHREIAEMFGLSQATVTNIVNFKIWKHV